MPEEQLNKAALKELARKVIVTQGNGFIKELLRDAGGKIGTTKDDFVANLDAAIDDDLITQSVFEGWLKEIEGWGNQHLYVVARPDIEPPELAEGFEKSAHFALLDGAATIDFPNALTLKSISLNGGLSIAWHQGKEGWRRHSDKDKTETEGLEFYRFDAYRQRLDRSVVRYEWRFDDPYAAILIHRNPAIDHAVVRNDVRTVLSDIGCPDEPIASLELSRAVKKAAKSMNGAHSTRFDTEGGFVQMASTLADGGIEAVEAVRVVLHAVDVEKFERAQGMFHFLTEEHGVSRKLAVQIFGEEGRLRIWAQCKRDDVLQILRTVWEHNSAT